MYYLNPKHQCPFKGFKLFQVLKTNFSTCLQKKSMVFIDVSENQRQLQEKRPQQTLDNKHSLAGLKLYIQNR